MIGRHTSKLWQISSRGLNCLGYTAVANGRFWRKNRDGKICRSLLVILFLCFGRLSDAGVKLVVRPINCIREHEKLFDVIQYYYGPMKRKIYM